MDHQVSTLELGEALAGAPLPHTWGLLKQCEAVAATSSEDQMINVRRNMKLGLPMLNKMPEFNKSKGTKPCALVGGGPSLKDPKILEELRGFRTIFACGSVHDYLMSQGIIPTYASNCDPDPVCANYFTRADAEVKYLMASNSAEELINCLKDKQIILWHCHSEEMCEETRQIEEALGNKEYHGVGGGCTIGLRTLSLALGLGYTNIHFFGFDSCMDSTGLHHHAYDFTEEKEYNVLGQIYRIRIGGREGPGDKIYHVAGYQLAQAENFKDYYCRYSQFFECTFHGEGLLKDTYALLHRVDKELKLEREKELTQ